MKFGVVVFPGSNCDRDMIHVLRNVMEQEVEEIWHKTDHLDGFTTEDCIVLPGGFSYGDYLRTGAIARFSPVMKHVIDHANNGGKVFGICNGFQVLCESGLLPGVLLRNDNQKFICKNVHLKSVNDDSILTNGLAKDTVLKIPIAHAEGRFFAKEEEMKSIIENGQIAFKYCDEDGNEAVSCNPNGSLENIAGISSKNGKVIGMMPHPERAAEDILGNADGLAIMNCLLDMVSA
ncbi:MAG: phosphoribosylformylglycinamidine synthase subunit PurQ [Chitinophagales bacterium]